MKEFEFSLKIKPDAWLEYYRSPQSTVVATTVHGKRVRFSARHLVPHVTRDGILGTFVLTIDYNNDFVSLMRKR
ncbi:MAG: hypothetical protein CMH52_06260 [Myxococcales bacterium]|nr:hypothetical protein [Myxococcales bacterium]